MNSQRFLLNFIKICHMMAKFSGFELERTLSKFRKRKRKFHLLHKRACEIRKFHVTVVYVYSSNPQKHSHHVGLRACLHGGGGPEVGEVTRLGGVTRLSI